MPKQTVGEFLDKCENPWKINQIEHDQLLELARHAVAREASLGEIDEAVKGMSTSDFNEASRTGIQLDKSYQATVARIEGANNGNK